MVIDFHAHILPGADHGCDSTDTAHRQLCLLRDVGTEAVVATPHFYPNHDSVRSFLDRRDGALAAMRRHLPLSELPRVYPAAEVLVCPGIHEMDELERLSISGTNIILLEMPFIPWNDTLMNAVLGVRRRGLVPVLAHIDRYAKDDVDALLREGISAQINAEAFGFFGSRRVFLPLVEQGSVVALGSDLHNAHRSDCKRFLRMRKRLGKYADTVFDRTAALLKDATPLQAKGEQEKQEVYT